MARALIGGLLRQGATPRASERRANRTPDARAALEREFAVRAAATTRPRSAAPSSSYWPSNHRLPARCCEACRAGAAGAASPLLLSIAAGPANRGPGAAAARPDPPIVRAMPNRPALLGPGITGLYAPAVCDRGATHAGRTCSARRRPLRLVARRGASSMSSRPCPAAARPISFCWPSSWRRPRIELGLEPQTAALLATETLHGAARWRSGDTSLAEERAAVTSSGGTTEAALRALESGGFDALIAQRAARRRRRAAPSSPIAARPASESTPSSW